MSEPAADPEQMDTVYDPRVVEPPIYADWERTGAFRSVPDDSPHARAFTIVIPPPNVTGALHLGHALNNTLQDILVRYHRMRGFNTLWQPGTDHAGIATQAVVERRIRETEGKSRHELGREELVRRIWQWKDEYERRILSQLKLMGCSCDWERTRFTLDEGLARAVRHMFFKLFRDGLIFRGKRLVNWDTQLQTAVSDDEVYYETVKGHFWHIRYPVIDPQPGEPEYVVIATTRPETMLGDVAVAVHPNPERFFGDIEAGLRDELERTTGREQLTITDKLEGMAARRDSHLPLLKLLSDMARSGRRLRLPLVEREIPLIVDEWADPTLGTGCVKITPAHDPNDYEVGQRHSLSMINVLTPDGLVATINEPDAAAAACRPGTSENIHSGKFAGRAFSTAGREKVVADLEAAGLIDRVEERDIEIGHSDRSKSPIEPFLSDQWFLKTGAPGISISEPRASARANVQTDWATPSPSLRRQPVPYLAEGATLLTWTTYGTWLPGDDRGSVSRAPRGDGLQALRNLPGEPYDHDDEQRRMAAAERMDGQPVLLGRDHAEQLLGIIAECCARHGMELLAVAIMPNHVHVLCQGEQHGREMLQVIKGNASRRLSQKFDLKEAPRWWTKSGSRRRIKRGADLTTAIEYVMNQENPLLMWTLDAESGVAVDIVEEARRRVERESLGAGEAQDIGTFAQAEARGSGGGSGTEARRHEGTKGLADAAMDAVTEGRIQVFPARYAKSYLDWLGEKRDWCISRQLWWGHRIPVWTMQASYHDWLQRGTEDIDHACLVGFPEGKKICVRAESAKGEAFVVAGVERAYEELVALRDAVYGGRIAADELLTWHVAVKEESVEVLDQVDRSFAPFERWLESNGFAQDPDVLDTWFSSALWPFSTLGWPDDTAHLKQYYPTTVLCTSRDIITNWVARMVMFGLHAMKEMGRPPEGQVPFDHVYVHPKILDGRGETMSKSKGNGVDPVDIIHTHGADALRYTMADMTTETQDIRMPVNYVCPHCGHLTDQAQALKAEEQNRKSRGEKLERKLQPADCRRVKCTSKACGKEFATQWADEATRSEIGLAREASEKFDIGRNFCNKLWNAARYAFMNLQGASCDSIDPTTLRPEDRWILARLSQTIRRVHESLAGYHFSATIRELRDFFWDSLCDWYIELTKPRLTSEPRASARADVAEFTDHTPGSSDPVKQVLAFCLDQVLRLWHPVMPFITEHLWRQLQAAAPRRGLPPLIDLTTDSDLIRAAYPPVEGYPPLEDEAVLATFALLQDATRGVRDLRSRCNVPPRSLVTATVVVSEDQQQAFESHAHIVRHMAHIGDLRITTTPGRPPNAGSVTIRHLRIYVHDISDDVAEHQRVTKALADANRQIATREAKLANEKFIANARPELVETERQRLAELVSERDGLSAQLAELGG